MLRSLVVGGAATVAGFAALGAMVYGFDIAPQVANLPSLLIGAAVQFIGSRRWAFEATAGSVRRQMLLFTLVEIVTLALNGGIYHVLISIGPDMDTAAWWPMAARVMSESAVFFGWSYPMWRRVFRVRTRDVRISSIDPAVKTEEAEHGQRSKVCGSLM